MTHRIDIRAPASTANLGSAFDSGAIGLTLYNELSAEVAAIDAIQVSGEGQAALATGTPNLVLAAADRLFAQLHRRRPGLHLRLRNAIPFGRGLGSSAAAIAAGLRLGEALAETTLPEQELLALAAEIEGHGDNTSAALLGGCTFCVSEPTGLTVLRLDLPPGLRLAVFAPDYAVSTAEARAVLPERIPRADAVFNVGRAALLGATLASGRLDLLGTAMEDRLHQPYRLPLYRSADEIMGAARAAGAYGAAISGAGPSVVALVAAMAADAVAAAMQAAARRHDVTGKSFVLAVATEGTTTRIAPAA